MKNISKVLLIVFLTAAVFSLTATAQLAPEDQTRIYLADDLNLINESVFYKDDILEEKDYQNWINKTFKKQFDFSQLSTDQNSSLEYGEAAAYLVNALDQKEFALTYELAEPIAYMRTADLMDLFSELNSTPDLDQKVTMINGLRILITALDRADIHYQAIGDLDDETVYSLAEDNIEEFYNRNLLETDAEGLFELGNQGLTDIPGGIFTGYTIKNPIERPIFDFSMTIRYGHASLSHLRQMISLLKREGYDAEIAVESRTSSYVHLIDEWGPPAEDVNQTPINDSKTVVHADEYDLLIEFKNTAEMQQFSDLISEYAQKEEEGQSGLIKNSWFVPLFTSKKKLDNFVKVDEVRVEHNGYALISYALSDYSEDVKRHLEEINPDYKIEINPIWINESFLSYLQVNVD